MKIAPSAKYIPACAGICGRCGNGMTPSGRNSSIGNYMQSKISYKRTDPLKRLLYDAALILFFLYALWQSARVDVY